MLAGPPAIGCCHIKSVSYKGASSRNASERTRTLTLICNYTVLILLTKYVRVLYVTCNFAQLDNTDEQASQVRRELDSRLAAIEQILKVRGSPLAAAHLQPFT